MDNGKKIEHYGWQAPDITPKIEQFPAWGQPVQMDTDRFKNEETGVEPTVEGAPQIEVPADQAQEQGGPPEQTQTWDGASTREEGDDTTQDAEQSQEVAEEQAEAQQSQGNTAPFGFDFSAAAEAPEPEDGAEDSVPAESENPAANIQHFGWGSQVPTPAQDIAQEVPEIPQEEEAPVLETPSWEPPQAAWMPQTPPSEPDVHSEHVEGQEYPKKGKKSPPQEPVDEPIILDGANKPRKKKKASDTAPEMSKQEKKLQKKKKSKEDTTMRSEKASNGAMVLVKLLVCASFAVFVVIQGLGRIQTAKALVGSTEWEKPTDSNPIVDISIDDPNEEFISEDTEYQYISEEKLAEKTPTELAVWYLTEFPDGKPHNENALAEFEDWFMMKEEDDTEFKPSYDEALAYVREHPEILNPPQPEKPKKDEQPEPPSTTATEPDTTNPTTPSTGTESGGTTTPTNPSGTVTPVEESRFTSIKESEMNAMTAAQVSNWVQKTFPAGQTGWDYTKLTEFYEWLATKDDLFVSKVNGFLEVSGWSGSIT